MMKNLIMNLKKLFRFWDLRIKWRRTLTYSFRNVMIFIDRYFFYFKVETHSPTPRNGGEIFLTNVHKLPSDHKETHPNTLRVPFACLSNCNISYKARRNHSLHQWKPSYSCPLLQTPHACMWLPARLGGWASFRPERRTWMWRLVAQAKADTIE
jgi:hypothetical protein